MFPTKATAIAFSLALFAAEIHADSDEPTHGGVVPLHTISSGQWIEKVVGDMDKPGQPFVIRIHHDPGYIVLPHTHTPGRREHYCSDRELGPWYGSSD